jgi:hypothetical protein
MQRVVNFYEKLPRGAAPAVKATGILGRYQAKHFGKNPTAKRMCLASYPSWSRDAVLTFSSHHPRHRLAPHCRLCAELLLPPA